MKIIISRGATINIGNYESARLDISFELECEAEEAVAGLLNADVVLIGELHKRLKSIQSEAGLPPQPVTRFTGKA